MRGALEALAAAAAVAGLVVWCFWQIYPLFF